MNHQHIALWQCSRFWFDATSYTCCVHSTICLADATVCAKAKYGFPTRLIFFLLDCNHATTNTGLPTPVFFCNNNSTAASGRCRGKPRCAACTRAFVRTRLSPRTFQNDYLYRRIGAYWRSVSEIEIDYVTALPLAYIHPHPHPHAILML